MRTKAARSDAGYVLNGVKRWITNAGVSKYYTVMAVTDPAAGANGISAFVLEDGDEGFTFGAPEHKLGIKGSPTRELYFDNCEIPADRLIGTEGEGFKIALRTLDHTRITIAAQALGIAQGALDYALGYMRERKQFGKPIAEFQGLQFMIADMAMKLEAARQLTYAAAARSDRAMAGERVADLTFMSSACKCLASDVAMQATTDAVQLLGGYGYVTDPPKWVIHGERLVDDTPHIRVSLADVELPNQVRFTQYVFRMRRCAMTVVLDDAGPRQRLPREPPIASESLTFEVNSRSTACNGEPYQAAVDPTKLHVCPAIVMVGPGVPSWAILVRKSVVAVMASRLGAGRRGVDQRPLSSAPPAAGRRP
jgi:hypothetical protein